MQNPTYFYNPLYEIGINTIEFLNSTVLYASNDLSEWIQVGSATKITIPASYRNYKYWKLVPSSGSYITAMTAPSTYTGKALHFNTAPPAGAIITADYECDVIAKDENNVFKLTYAANGPAYAQLPTIHLSPVVIATP